MDWNDKLIMKAIQTKIMPATDYKGTRIVATAEGHNQLVVNLSDNLTWDQNHEFAANALAVKLGWRGRMVSGELLDGMVHVFTEIRQNNETIYIPTFPVGGEK